MIRKDPVPSDTKAVEPKAAKKTKKTVKAKAPARPKITSVGKGKAALAHLMPDVRQYVILPRLSYCLQSGAQSFKDLLNVYAQVYGVRLSETTMRQWCKDCGIRFEMRMTVSAPQMQQPQWNVGYDQGSPFVPQPTQQIFIGNPKSIAPPTHFHPQTQEQMKGTGGFQTSPTYARDQNMPAFPERLMGGLRPFPSQGSTQLPSLTEMANGATADAPFGT